MASKTGILDRTTGGKAAAKGIRVLMVEPIGYGGLALYAHDLCEKLSRRGAEVTLLTSVDYEFTSAAKDFELAAILLGFRRGSPASGRLTALFKKARSFLKYLKNLALTYRIASAGGFDIIHVQWLPDRLALLTVRALRKAGRPIIYTAHDVLPLENAIEKKRLFLNIYSVVDRVIVHSRYARDLLTDLSPRTSAKTALIPHGCSRIPLATVGGPPVGKTEAKAALGISPEKRVAGFIGAIKAYKGLDALISAFSKIARDLPESVLLIAGGGEIGPLSGTLSELESGGKAVVMNRYLTWEETHTSILASDLVVLPYKHVYTSGVLHMAQAYGVPVVATSVGGLTEVIRHGETGLLVPPDDPDALAKALARALADREGLQILSGNCLNEAQNAYSWERVAESTYGLYADMLRPPPAKPFFETARPVRNGADRIGAAPRSAQRRTDRNPA